VADKYYTNICPEPWPRRPIPPTHTGSLQWRPNRSRQWPNLN